MIIQN